MSATDTTKPAPELVELEQLMCDAWRQQELTAYDEFGEPILIAHDEFGLPDGWRSFHAPEPWRTVSEWLRRQGVRR